MKAIPLLLALFCTFTLAAKDKEKHKKMALSDRLVAYWNMAQDPALFVVHDGVFPHLNPLTGHGFSPDLTPPGSLVNGKLGKAIQFNGINQYLTIASNTGFSHQNGEFTSFIWFKPTVLAHQKIIATTAEWGVSTELSGGSHYISVSIEDEDVLITDVPLVVGQWYFIALGYRETLDIADTSVIWASVNLSKRFTDLQAGLTPVINPFSIGGTANIGWINGVIDDVAIFRRALSDVELRRIYNGGDGLPFEEWPEAEPCETITCCD